ncbi:Predicted dehydrogenase [Paenibacillus sp. 1_12]|uniref:Gfo/Idh/MocA family protein n=1 Tax=Paenibacillus sp. 1_12 TaxID=1566278 RepID=UPI0008E8934D|nr:Gfo/Idh/MocA family oxidoreductase [Paenibacillus sp. 1_12]SFL68681.1 Predicted dehydrogenase [Paenibacillus sp. 1_12]
MRAIRTALIGLGGFGKVHIRHLVELSGQGLLEVTAFSDINPDINPSGWQQLLALGGAPYSDYKTMLDHHPELDLVVIASPIPMHKEMAMYAFSRGIHVMLEKPPAVTIQDLDEMLHAQAGSSSLCQVNFQNTSGAAFRELLHIIQEGQLGDVQSVTGVGLWKRTQAYYDRTPWAGKLKYKGNYVLDGTINNPFAHLLNNCLLVAGGGNAEESTPLDIQAELYHANAIEGEDTSCLRIRTQSGAIVHFYASLCHEGESIPSITVKGTLGEAVWKYNNMLAIQITGSQPTSRSFGEEDYVHNMYLNTLAAIQDESVALLSSLQQCRQFVLAVNGAFESSGETHPISDVFLVRRNEGNTVFTGITGIGADVGRAATDGMLFSEMGIPWAVAAESFSLGSYQKFGLFSS